MEICKDLVTYIKRSEIQHRLQTTLKQSIDIRWDSRLNLLISIKENYDSLVKISETNEKLEDFISKIDFKLLCDIIEVLNPFHKFRLELCYDSKATFHLPIPIKIKLIKFCDPKETDTELIKSLKKILKENTMKYLKTTEFNLISTMLFPPLKHLKSLCSESERLSAIISLKSMVESIPKTTSITQSTDSDQKFNDCISDFIVNDNQSEQECEVDMYLNTNTPFSPSDDVLNFWECNKEKYPRLYAITQRLFSISATNLSSERNFSYTGMTLTDKRSTINPDKVNKLLFIRSNFDLISDNLEYILTDNS